MRSLVLAPLLASFLSLSLACRPEPIAVAPPAGPPPALPRAAFGPYPVSKTVDQVDTLHGVAVTDPYRWLEELDSEATRAWIEAENAVTFSYLEGLPDRVKIRAHLEKLWNFQRWGTPSQEGGRYFMVKNDGLQNQSVWFWAESLDAEPKVLLDPNALSNDGTIAVSGAAISEDGKLLAYGLSSSGSDWQEWRVRDVATGTDLDDHLKWIKFSGVSWSPDHKGFYYSRYDEPKSAEAFAGTNYFQKLFYHQLGTLQSADKLIYERKDHKDWNFGGRVSDDGRWLVIDSSVGTDRRNRIFVRDLQNKKGKVQPLIDELDAAYNFLGSEGSTLWFHSEYEAPRGRIIAIDVANPKRENWKETVPQNEHTLRGASLVGDRFILEYMADAKSLVRAHRIDGTLEREIALPGIGSAGGFGGDRDDKETFYSFTSFTTPATVLRYDIASGQSTVWKEPKLAFDPEKYQTKQVFYPSKDGTKVPMFITHKRDLNIDGDRPTYLYGYGGFNAPLTPSFSVATMVWLEMGGVYAQPNLRGGGEYGEAWHLAGTKLQKQNVFDDFIAAAEWLIENRYTKPAKLAIGGRSNGGLLVGAAMTQRPDLFGAVLAGVGVMDMLRFHLFTIGWAWVSDYGSAEDAGEFAALHAYSPYHNLKAGTDYPATMVHTADHDDRVVPSHSFKFAARLQAAHGGPDPVLIRVDVKAGHGAGKPTTKQIDEWADLWAFVADNLAMKVGL